MGFPTHHPIRFALLAPLVGMMAALAAPGSERDLRLEITFPASTNEAIEITRADLIISEVSFQRPDGTWLPPARWEGFYSANMEDNASLLRGLPCEPFQAIRFMIGLPEKINHADPASFPADHPLNPRINNMHWQWQTGYIFIAVEGQLKSPENPSRGFSYHVGNNANHLPITVPVSLPPEHRTLRLAFDLNHFLDFDLANAKPSTHSRVGDTLATDLAQRATDSFTFAGTRPDLVQPDLSPSPSALPKGTHPYPINITARFPKVALPPDNPLTVEGVALGKELFFNPSLSRDRSVSCASCHHPDAAFADPGKAFSIGIDGRISTRNSMPLFNLAWHEDFFWDGRASTLREQVLHPIEHPDEMGHDLDLVIPELEASHAEEFATAFGSPGVNRERLAKSLEQYLLTIVSQDSDYDQAIRGETKLSDQEKRGFQLFITENDPANHLHGADCFHCHGGNLFTNHGYHNNGLDSTFDDEGLAAITGREEDRGKFKTPSLRNIALTAPYMHDGRFATLEEVVEHYNSGVHPSPTLDPNLSKHQGLGLSSSEQADLVAFLKTLSDPSYPGIPPDPEDVP